MSESEQSNKVNEFAGIANVDQERARFYLESAAWNMDVMIIRLLFLLIFFRLGFEYFRGLSVGVGQFLRRGRRRWAVQRQRCADFIETGPGGRVKQGRADGERLQLQQTGTENKEMATTK